MLSQTLSYIIPTSKCPFLRFIYKILSVLKVASYILLGTFVFMTVIYVSILVGFGLTEGSIFIHKILDFFSFT